MNREEICDRVIKLRLQGFKSKIKIKRLVLQNEV